MSDLTFNKIAGGVLLTGLIIFGLREASTIVFEKHEPEKAGYEIAVEEPAAGGAAAVVEVAPDWGTALLLPANIAAGEAISAKCQACHKLDPSGANSTGPGLYGVEGRQPGSHPGFAYSAAMKEFGAKNAKWDYDHMYEFLKSPGNYISGTNMSFVGLKKPEDRVALIAYLHTLGSTLPVPAPKPADAAAAAPAEGAAAAAPAGAAPAAAAPSAGQPTTPAPAADVAKH